MRTSRKGIEFIKAHEGLMTDVYNVKMEWGYENNPIFSAELVNNNWIEGGIVTIRIKSGEVSSITVKDKDGDDIEVTERNNNYNKDYNVYYTFVMPKNDVVVIIN